MGYKVALIILFDQDTRFLLQHRTFDAVLLPGYWAFFGGEVEKNETPYRAVIREGYEELNVKLKSPKLVIEQDFTEGDVAGRLFIFIEAFYEDKAALKLCEGQGWGWYKESEMCGLKMVERDRYIIRRIGQYLT